MKKIISSLVLFLVFFSLACADSSDAIADEYEDIETSSYKLYSGTSLTTIAYTVKGSRVYNGTSSTNVAYTIRGSKICKGTSQTDVAYNKKIIRYTLVKALQV